MLHRYLRRRCRRGCDSLPEAGQGRVRSAQDQDQDTSDSSPLALKDQIPEHARVTVGPGGRIVIPGDFRQALGLEDGDAVVIELENDALRLVSYETELRRIRELVSGYVPEGVSLVDELIAARRREAEVG